MPISRRKLLIGAGAGALLAAAGPLRAMPAAAPTLALIRKTIPSTGETMVPVGIGTARRYQGAASAEQMAPLRAAIQTFHNAGGTAGRTAATMGRGEGFVQIKVAHVKPCFFCPRNA